MRDGSRSLPSARDLPLRGQGMHYTDGWRAYASVLKFVPTPRLIALIGTATTGTGEHYLIEEELWARQGNDRTAAAYIIETLPF